ncbi:hypothetical protein [Arachnia propionica]|uniref:hypothetical protein n=1 Tax=Arachnia propionica TaxID=1750 RepID=UPI0024328534|nr:hypothetical protein [Arachnia propionica]
MAGGTDQAAIIGYLGVMEPPHGLEDLESHLSTAFFFFSFFVVVDEIVDQVLRLVDGTDDVLENGGDFGSGGHD